ncbi:integrator complex subunit 13-like isoform X16 [Dreissena polymorpha]|uniref:integrator complex subunit 13-like isoform X16 n=1 Tax=Dreissena polymorpha TaxID=45954 RepID=UPI002263FCA3|nr:integrator complex subunit 13-like isoform X16 [Dreissena polymorpha]
MPKNTETDSEPKLLSLRTHHEHDCKSQPTSSSEVKAASPLHQSLLPINFCELDLMHVVPVDEVPTISPRVGHEISPILSCTVHVSESGREQYNRLIQMAYNHYRLASTTVTGIPMKEEQNASSSANYDVELLHPAEAHDEILKSDFNKIGSNFLSGSVEGLMIDSKEGLPISTITLKWCTPKSSVQDLPACTGAYRITPVDVNSRPSSCLTNFLLSGRAVMLEQPRKTGVKVVSHMLTSHGGEIFIHSIPTGRSILEDPPSISEGPGGRVTDYRIPDFREFMKENRLAPVSPAVAKISTQLPIQRALHHVERTSRFWPMVISDSIIFNMASHIDPLPSMLVKERLSDDDELECRKAIFHVVGMETRNEPLPVNLTGTRIKGNKREQQYSQMWSELETLVRAHANTSEAHKRVLECLLECKKPSDDRRKLDKTGSGKEDLSEVESAWKDLDKYQKMTDHEKREFNKVEAAPEDTGPLVKRLRSGFTEPLVKTSGKQSLLSIWTNRIKSVHSQRHEEFIGRQENKGTIADLYRHMFENDGNEEIPVGKP